MALNYNIVPIFDDFKKEEVDFVCKSLEGDPLTIVYSYDKQDRLLCGEFQLQLNYSKFKKITGCTKYLCIHEEPEYLFSAEIRKKFTFTCVVIKPQTSKVINTEVEPHFGKIKSFVEFPIEPGIFHLNFLQHRKKFSYDYNTGLSVGDSEVTVFAVRVLDDRHIWAITSDSITSKN